MSGGERAPLAVVTATLDDLDRLRATAWSVLEQTPRPPAWIVVDGGSRDGTREWLLAEAGRIAWWRSAPDRGIYHAMNIGLGIARTLAESVVFLNAGDRFASADAAESIAEAFLGDSEVDFIYADAVEEDEIGRLHLKRSRSHSRAAMGMFTHHQSMAYRLSPDFEIVFDERFTIGSDYAFTLFALARSRKIARLAKPVALVSPPGFSARNAELGRFDQFRIRREVLGMGILRCAAVRLAQRVAQLTRESAPGLYRRLRFQTHRLDEWETVPLGQRSSRR